MHANLERGRSSHLVKGRDELDLRSAEYTMMAAKIGKQEKQLGILRADLCVANQKTRWLDII